MWLHQDGQMYAYPPDHGPIKKSDVYSGINFITLFKPYRNVIDGREISTRHQHREFLKINNCEEVGEEKPNWMRESEYLTAHGAPVEALPRGETPIESDGLTEHERGKFDVKFEYQDVPSDLMEEVVDG